MNLSDETREIDTRITVKEAAEILGVSPQFIRLGLQQKVLPIGAAVKMSSVWTYHISPKKLYEYIGPEDHREVNEESAIEIRESNHHKLYMVRRDHGYHQKDIAKKLGIHNQTYYLKESGKKDFTITEAKMLAKVFNCTLDELFGD